MHRLCADMSLSMLVLTFNVVVMDRHEVCKIAVDREISP